MSEAPIQLALVFPGQGSQSVGMLAELSELHPSVKATFEEASDGAGVDLWALSQAGPEEMLNRTEYTQPALLAAGIAAWRLWNAQGGTPPAVLAGHSLGEYTALVAAGALSLQDGAHLVRIRGQLMQDAAPAGVGAMAAVLGAEDALVEAVCAEVSGSKVVVPANYNSPGQIVIGGDAAAVDAAQSRARATVMTLYVMATDIGAALGPFLGYLMAELWGTAAMYQAAALWLAALGLWWLVAGHRGALQ